MITFRAYNIIIPKFRIEDEIAGGMTSIYHHFSKLDFQEDEYLVGIGVANATEVRQVFERLLQLGLSFDDASDSSDHFAVMAKEGMWWPVPWLIYSDEGCWFIADVEAPQLKNKSA